MKATFETAAPCAGDVMNLAVADVNDAVPLYETTLGFHIVSRENTRLSASFYS